MDDWSGLRAAAVIVAWVTVLGGLVLGAAWLALGGGRAFGPEDELMAQSQPAQRAHGQRRTAFSSVQIGMHGILGITTAFLLTYAAGRSDDRFQGYVAVLVVAAVTGAIGLLMFRKWRSDRRPAIDGSPTGDRGPKVEDRLPKAVVYGHGLAAAVAVALVVILVVLE